MSDAEGIVIPADVYVQLERIRRSGEMNMGYRKDVQAVANRREFFAAVVWLEDNHRDYFRGFIEGFKPDREVTDDEQAAIEAERWEDGW